MSMTVRFPNGQFVTYNAACYLLRGAEAWNLYTKQPDKGGEWVASIQASAGCIVEVVKPCSIGVIHIEPDTFVQELMDRMRAVSAYRLADLKKALVKFNARSRCWR